MFPAMVDAYSEFRKHSVLRVKCEDCQVILRIGESSILKSVYDHGDEELQDIVRSLIKRKMAFLPTCCDDFPDKFKIVEDQMFLFLMFEQPISNLGQSSVINVGNAEFQMLSCVSQTNRSVSESKNAIFKHKDLYLSQSAQDIVNVAFPGDIRNVSLIFFGRVGVDSTTNVRPYDRSVFYETSNAGKDQRKSYEKSDEGKSRQKAYEESNQGNDQRKSYEKSDQGKDQRKSYEK